MTVQSIVDRSLVIKISDPKVAEALEPLDRNRDKKITADDFMTALPALPKDAGIMDRLNSFWTWQVHRYNGTKIMQRAVALRLVESGLLTFIQSEGLSHFFDLYNDVIFTRNRVGDWTKNNTDTWGSEMEFNRDYWRANVEPLFNGYNFLSNSSDFISQRLYNVLGNLSNVNDSRLQLFSKGCGEHVSGLVVYGSGTPNFLGENIDELAGAVNFINGALKGYRELECGECSILEDNIEYSTYVPSILVKKGGGKGLDVIRTKPCGYGRPM